MEGEAGDQPPEPGCPSPSLGSPARAEPWHLQGPSSATDTRDPVPCRRPPCLWQTLAWFSWEPASALINWVILGESPTLSGTQFPHLQNRELELGQETQHGVCVCVGGGLLRDLHQGLLNSSEYACRTEQVCILLGENRGFRVFLKGPMPPSPKPLTKRTAKILLPLGLAGSEMPPCSMTTAQK